MTNPLMNIWFKPHILTKYSSEGLMMNIWLSVVCFVVSVCRCVIPCLYSASTLSWLNEIRAQVSNRSVLEFACSRFSSRSFSKTKPTIWITLTGTELSYWPTKVPSLWGKKERKKKEKKKERMKEREREGKTTLPVSQNYTHSLKYCHCIWSTITN